MESKIPRNQEFILVADPEAHRRKMLRDQFADLTNPILYARDGEEALRFARSHNLILAILSQDLLQTKGTHLGRLLQKSSPCEVILYGDGSHPIAPGDLLGHQIDDYLPVLNDPAELRLITLRHLRRINLARENGIIGQSPKMKEVLDHVVQIAQTNSTVLITGESGTGKEVIARAIHQASSRRNAPFIGVNVGALPETLLESELFGHEKGSFTGAVTRRVGHFELANHGTLFLDEIGEMSLSTQVKLLRVLEEREFMRVGGHQIIKVDVRVVAATNRDLVGAINEKIFRQDLYYRLKVVTIHLPPLRQRPEDIPMLIDHFVEKFKTEHDSGFHGFSPEARHLLLNYNWPGNIRELENFVESMIVLYSHKEIQAADLPDQFRGSDTEMLLPVPGGRPRDEIERELIYKSIMGLREDIQNVNFQVDRIWNTLQQALTNYQPEVSIVEVGRTMDEVEEAMIRATLKEKSNNRRETAKILGISERTLYRKMEKYGIM